MKTRIGIWAARTRAEQLIEKLNKRRLDELEADARRLVANRNEVIEFLARFLGRWVLRYRSTLHSIHTEWMNNGRFKDAQKWYWYEQSIAEGVLRLCNATDNAEGDGFIEIDEHEARHLGYEP